MYTAGSFGSWLSAKFRPPWLPIVGSFFQSKKKHQRLHGFYFKKLSVEFLTKQDRFQTGFKTAARQVQELTFFPTFLAAFFAAFFCHFFCWLFSADFKGRFSGKQILSLQYKLLLPYSARSVSFVVFCHLMLIFWIAVQKSVAFF